LPLGSRRERKITFFFFSQAKDSKYRQLQLNQCFLFERRGDKRKVPIRRAMRLCSKTQNKYKKYCFSILKYCFWNCPPVWQNSEPQKFEILRH